MPVITQDRLIDELIQCGKLLVMLPDRESGLATKVWVRDDRSKAKRYLEARWRPDMNDYPATRVRWRNKLGASKVYTLSIDRIILVALYGPSEDKEAHHRDLDPSNNNWWNIEPHDWLVHRVGHVHHRNNGTFPWDPEEPSDECEEAEDGARPSVVEFPGDRWPFEADEDDPPEVALP